MYRGGEAMPPGSHTLQYTSQLHKSHLTEVRLPSFLPSSRLSSQLLTTSHPTNTTRNPLQQSLPALFSSDDFVLVNSILICLRRLISHRERLTEVKVARLARAPHRLVIPALPGLLIHNKRISLPDLQLNDRDMTADLVC